MRAGTWSGAGARLGPGVELCIGSWDLRLGWAWGTGAGLSASIRAWLRAAARGWARRPQSGAGPRLRAAPTVPARLRAMRRQRVGEDDGGHADHRGAGRALGRAAVHGFVLQGEGRAPRGGAARRGAERRRSQVLDEGQQALAARSDYNFDHPDAFDFELLVSVLRKLKKGKSVKVPVYDFTTHSRRREWVGARGAPSPSG